MHLRKPALIASTLTFAFSTIPAFAQPAATAPEAPVQTLHVTSREVVIDVMVTDAEGKPVHDLQASNFAVTENGHPQIIRSFREFSPDLPIQEPTPPVLPIGVYTNSQSTPANGPVQIFLIDALHFRQVADAIHALNAAAEYFATMPRGTKVAIFYLSESGLHMMQGFTSDPAVLTRALHSSTIDIGSNQERHTTQWYTVDALNQIAAYVAGIKGRKNLLWITSGMPVNLMRDGGYSWPDGPGDMAMAHRLMDVYERFTAEQVAVSPIDPSGVRACATCNLGTAQLKDEQVAEQTGGEAFYNTNDLKTAIAKAIDDQSHFYTISYIPPSQKDDGHFHTIKVAVDQPSLHLVYRTGYDAERVPTPDAPAPGPELLKASMEGHTPARTQILFDVGVWPTPLTPAAQPAATPPAKAPKPKASPTISYEVHFGFPSSEIAFLEDPDGTLHGSLEFDIVAYNTDRKLVAHLTRAVALPFSPADFDEFINKPFHLNLQIALPPGPISLHVGILDNTSSRVGTLEIPLLVRR